MKRKKSASPSIASEDPEEAESPLSSEDDYKPAAKAKGKPKQTNREQAAPAQKKCKPEKPEEPQSKTSQKGEGAAAKKGRPWAEEEDAVFYADMLKAWKPDWAYLTSELNRIAEARGIPERRTQEATRCRGRVLQAKFKKLAG